MKLFNKDYSEDQIFAILFLACAANSKTDGVFKNVGMYMWALLTTINNMSKKDFTAIVKEREAVATAEMPDLDAVSKKVQGIMPKQPKQQTKERSSKKKRGRKKKEAAPDTEISAPELDPVES